MPSFFLPFFTFYAVRSSAMCGCRGGGGAPKGLVHNLLMQFFTMGNSKIEVFETCSSEPVIT